MALFANLTAGCDICEDVFLHFDEEYTVQFQVENWKWFLSKAGWEKFEERIWCPACRKARQTTP